MLRNEMAFFLTFQAAGRYVVQFVTSHLVLTISSYFRPSGASHRIIKSIEFRCDGEGRVEDGNTH